MEQTVAQLVADVEDLKPKVAKNTTDIEKLFKITDKHSAKLVEHTEQISQLQKQCKELRDDLEEVKRTYAKITWVQEELDVIHEHLGKIDETLEGHSERLDKHDKKLDQHMQELQRLENVKEDKIVVAELNRRLIQLKQDFEEFKENAVDPEEFKQVQEEVQEHGKQLNTQSSQIITLEKDMRRTMEKFLD